MHLCFWACKLENVKCNGRLPVDKYVYVVNLDFLQINFPIAKTMGQKMDFCIFTVTLPMN